MSLDYYLTWGKWTEHGKSVLFFFAFYQEPTKVNLVNTSMQHDILHPLSLQKWRGYDGRERDKKKDKYLLGRKFSSCEETETAGKHSVNTHLR